MLFALSRKWGEEVCRVGWCIPPRSVPYPIALYDCLLVIKKSSLGGDTGILLLRTSELLIFLDGFRLCHDQAAQGAPVANSIWHQSTEEGRKLPLSERTQPQRISAQEVHSIVGLEMSSLVKRV